MKKDKKENTTTVNSGVSKSKIVKITLNVDATCVSELIEKRLKELEAELLELNIPYTQEIS